MAVRALAPPLAASPQTACVTQAVAQGAARARPVIGEHAGVGVVVAVQLQGTLREWVAEVEGEGEAT